MVNLDEYHVTGDDPTGGHPTVVLTCDACNNNLIGVGDVGTWDNNDDIPSLAILIAAAERHEKNGHRAGQGGE